MAKCQQFELYAAEASVRRGRTLPADDLQAYVDELRDLPWWDSNFRKVERVDCRVRQTDREGSAGAWDSERQVGVVEMAPGHLTELIVLHEVSHVLAAARYGSRAHDPWFARTYLELVSVVLGPDAYLELRAGFRGQGVDFETEGTRGGIAL